jgi:long-chain fatty acid transport protein
MYIMKKIATLIAVVLFFMNQAIAGGILTNSNQSAQFVRMLSRNASTDLDAVYFNPAGLVRMDDGFYLAYHNQSIFQTKTVNNLFPLLNDATYIGDVSIPVFPTFFANYKKDKLAISFGVGPNAGGGTAEYKTGLPSFETSIAQLPTLLTSLGVTTTDYSADLFFKGTSTFWGFQLGISYAFNKIISGAAGLRYIAAVNTYDGHINNIMINPQHPQINPSGGFMSASDFFTAAGMTTYADATADKKVDVKQKGTGYTPIISVDIAPVEELNIGLKYEFKTKLEMENKTTEDGTGQFPDGNKFRNDIPAIFTAGVDYRLLPDFKLSTSFNYYFDKNSNRGGVEEIDKNYYELAFGGQYDITEKVAFSAGIMHSETGVGSGYQTDLSYSLSSNTVGLGGEFKISQKLTIDLGFLYTMYQNGEKEISYTGVGTFKETYDKSTVIFSVGFGYKIF